MVDAGPLVGLIDASDQWHDWCDKVFRALGGVRFATTETAIAEACHLLSFNRASVLDIMAQVQAGLIVVVPTLAENTARIRQLMEKYPRMDLGDATLVVLSERMPKARLITVDRVDFRVYRRLDGTLVPSIMPSDAAV